MAFWPEYTQALYVQQQNGIDTDCSFEFEVQSENGESSKKVVHGHKVVLSAVSDYFKANFKAEWELNQPIRVTNCEHSIFDKLIKAIYLPDISFDDLDEGCKLYEAAHFYCIEGTTKMIRDKIIEHWKCNKTLEISQIVNLSFKYEDDKLKYFSSKVFAQNAFYIVMHDPDFLKYNYEAINFFYQIDGMVDIVANEGHLLKGLEKYVQETETKKELIQPAIDAIRFPFLSKHQIKSTPLLTETERFCLLRTNAPKDAPKSQQPRKMKKFFHYLSPETQAQFRDKFSMSYCWVCKENHSVHSCITARNRYYGIYFCIESGDDYDSDGEPYTIFENYEIGVRLQNVEDYAQHEAIKILRVFQSMDNVNFQYFKNIEEEIEDIYLCEKIKKVPLTYVQ